MEESAGPHHVLLSAEKDRCITSQLDNNLSSLTSVELSCCRIAPNWRLASCPGNQLDELTPCLPSAGLSSC